MGLKDTLNFKGSVATQLLRDQHISTVELSEGFIENSVNMKDFLEHVDYSLTVHFPLEDNYLIPIFRPFLRKYLEFEEPIRVITGEHMTIRRKRQLIFRPGITETDEEIEVTQEELFEKCAEIARALLQHVYKEENGLFGLVDAYLPDAEKQKLSQKLRENLPVLEAKSRE